MKTLAILGSSRSDGNTARALESLTCDCSCEVIDLNARTMSGFRYDQDYSPDDPFMRIVEKIIEADHTILGTPVYWYSYSSVMKVFIDRFSDLLDSHKETGRRLRGKKFILLSTGSDPLPDPTLQAAYQNFCSYLGIESVGMVYAMESGQFSDAEEAARVRSLLGG